MTTYQLTAVLNGNSTGGITAFTFSPGATILTGNLGTGFAVPTGTTTTLWAGLTFDNVGTTTGATDTELNNFGILAMGPVDLGSSTNTGFQTAAAGSFFSTANSAGSGITFTGGTPSFDLGWELVVTTLPVELTSFGVE